MWPYRASIFNNAIIYHHRSNTRVVLEVGGQRMTSAWLLRVIATASLLALQSTLCVAQSNIGSAKFIRNQVQGILGEQTNRLSSGSSVRSNELIRSGDASLAELIFIDQTKLSVGPKSEVRLDKFVYDPNRGTGTVVLDATRGAYRFITGVQDHRNYEIKTPYATLGVRGTTLEIIFAELDRANPNRSDNRACERNVRIKLVEGAFEARTISGLTADVTDANTVLTVCSDGSFQTTQVTQSILNFTPRDFAAGPPAPGSPPGGRPTATARQATTTTASSGPPATTPTSVAGITGFEFPPELIAALGATAAALAVIFGEQTTSNPPMSPATPH